ncbi:MAG: GNAT family N-acetyltransferase [Aureispira sp.]
MYLFKSKRLGFRAWQDSDLAPLHALNEDPIVMEFFPATKTLEESRQFLERMKNDFKARQYCFFAVELLHNQEFVGFIGLSLHEYVQELGEMVEIGWRLQQKHWNQGYATEGAKACLKYGFERLQLTTIYAATPLINKKSQRIMQKIGMQFLLEFEEAKLASAPHLNPCVLYKIECPVE